MKSRGARDLDIVKEPFGKFYTAKLAAELNARIVWCFIEPLHQLA
jgi:hypothetical protein